MALYIIGAIFSGLDQSIDFLKFFVIGVAIRPGFTVKTLIFFEDNFALNPLKNSVKAAFMEP